MKSRQSWADLYAFEVIRESDTPLFRQLYLQLRAAILSRRLRPGTKLPSTRELAAQLGVSRSAAVAAYEQLLAEGYTSGRHGSGTYISPDLPEPIEGNPQRRKKPAAATTSKAVPMQPLGDFVDVTVQSDQRPFNLGRTLIDDRTLELWRKLSARTFRSLDASHFGYSDPRGTIELRKAICDYLQAARAVRCDPEQIVVTAGTQQAIDIVIRILPNREQGGLGRRSRLSADATGPARRRRDGPSDSRRWARHRRRHRHPIGAERLRGVRDALPPIPDGRRALDGPPP